MGYEGSTRATVGLLKHHVTRRRDAISAIVELGGEVSGRTINKSQSGEPRRMTEP